jgi:hypothetical protein
MTFFGPLTDILSTVSIYPNTLYQVPLQETGVRVHERKKPWKQIQGKNYCRRPSTASSWYGNANVTARIVAMKMAMPMQARGRE